MASDRHKNTIKFGKRLETVVLYCIGIFKISRGGKQLDPVAFNIFGIDVMWYGIIISIGVILGTAVAMKGAKREGVKEDLVLDLLIVAIPLAIVGARIYYVAFSWDSYAGDIKSILNIREGGLAIHGGLIAATITAYIFCRVKKLKFWKIADIMAPGIVLGQAIGRWGNYVNQEAHGGPTDLPWAITVDGVGVHPTFLYESIWNLGVLGLLLYYRKKGKAFEGEIFLMYIALYSLGRLFIEGLRTDSLMFGGIRVAQLLSASVIIVALYFIYRNRKLAKAKGK